MRRPAFGSWTARFDEDRNGHPHGGLDIAPPDPGLVRKEERRLFAIETGLLLAHEIHMSTPSRDLWNAYGRIKFPNGEDYPFANYTFEFYGVCLVLRAASGRTYLYAHLNEVPYGFHSSEQFFEKEAADRWVRGTMYSAKQVWEGEEIGEMGWAGMTRPGDRTGMHLHIEGHPGRAWVPHGERIRIEDELKEIKG